MPDWNNLISCPKCDAANPADAVLCVRCSIGLKKAYAAFDAVRRAGLARMNARAARVSGGLLRIGARVLRFRVATCDLTDGGLFVQAKGDNCRIAPVGIPFPRVPSCADLPGMVWAPDANELAAQSDVLEEGGLWIRRARLEVDEIRVECLSYNKRKKVLTIRIDVKGRLPRSRSDTSAQISLSCAVSR